MTTSVKTTDVEHDNAASKISTRRWKFVNLCRKWHPTANQIFHSNEKSVMKLFSKFHGQSVTNLLETKKPSILLKNCVLTVRMPSLKKIFEKVVKYTYCNLGT